MSKLPRNCRWKRLVKVLEKLGFKFSNVEGSHYVMIKLDCRSPKIIVVPMHNPLKVGTLNQKIKDADLSRKKFMELYKDP